MRSEHLQLGACAGALAFAVVMASSLPSARGDAKAGTIGVDEIKEGMRGYGLTVFKGTNPEKFDVEVIGVLHNFRPGQELILVKTPHPRLNITKNVKGMSGSPIYLDGRLAGAYAYSWASFQVEPVAGVTPIAPMLAELRRPIPAGFWPLEGRAPLPGLRAPPKLPKDRGKTAFDGPPGSYDIEEHHRQMAERMALDNDPQRVLVPAATPLLMGGMSDRATAFARKLFEPLGLEPMQAGGGGKGAADPTAPAHFVDGGAVGVSFVRGDVSMMGLGTVTHVEGTKLCAFGHPMMGVGDSALPTDIGSVLWIFASDQHSSKIGEAVRHLGTMVQDRQSAIVVDESKVAPVFPFHVEIRGAGGAPKTMWNMEVADEKYMSAGLIASALGSVLEATASERRDVTWHLHSTVKVEGYAALDLDDFGVAIGGTPDQDDWVRSRVARVVGDVLNNPWELRRIEGIASVLTLEYHRDLVRIRGAELLDATPFAGDRARIKLHLLPYVGPEETRIVDVPIPKELGGKDIEIEIVPGYELTPDVAAPETLGALLANATRTSALPKSVVAQIKLPSVGVSYRGHVADRLPSFALDALRPASSDLGPDPFASYARTEFAMDRYIDGHARLRVKVRAVVR